MRNAPAERSGESGSATRGIAAGPGVDYFLLIQWLKNTKLAFGAVVLAAARAELLHEKNSRQPQLPANTSSATQFYLCGAAQTAARVLCSSNWILAGSRMLCLKLYF